MRLLRSARGIVRECLQARRRLPDARSFLRYAADILLYRVLYFRELPAKDKRRTIRVAPGVEVVYRLNRGDIQTIREVWLEESYRPPVDLELETVIDLGANIALTSLWYAKRYGASRFVCVEPSAENVSLARENLAANGVSAEIVEAAVDTVDGSVPFHADRASNLGQVGDGAESVSAVSMETVLARLPAPERVDLVKMDIEGAEERLLRGDLGWLERVRSLIVEFHPDRVDYPGLVAILEGRGFRYVPAGSVRWNSMDFFIKEADPAG